MGADSAHRHRCDAGSRPAGQQFTATRMIGMIALAASSCATPSCWWTSSIRRSDAACAGGCGDRRLRGACKAHRADRPGGDAGCVHPRRSDLQRLAIALIFGIFVSTVLTLVVDPVAVLRAAPPVTPQERSRMKPEWMFVWSGLLLGTAAAAPPPTASPEAGAPTPATTRPNRGADFGASLRAALTAAARPERHHGRHRLLPRRRRRSRRGCRHARRAPRSRPCRGTSAQSGQFARALADAGLARFGPRRPARRPASWWRSPTVGFPPACPCVGCARIAGGPMCLACHGKALEPARARRLAAPVSDRTAPPVRGRRSARCLVVEVPAGRGPGTAP